MLKTTLPYPFLFYIYLLVGTSWFELQTNSEPSQGFLDLKDLNRNLTGYVELIENPMSDIRLCCSPQIYR